MTGRVRCSRSGSGDKQYYPQLSLTYVGSDNCNIQCFIYPLQITVRICASQQIQRASPWSAAVRVDPNQCSSPQLVLLLCKRCTTADMTRCWSMCLRTLSKVARLLLPCAVPPLVLHKLNTLAADCWHG